MQGLLEFLHKNCREIFKNQVQYTVLPTFKNKDNIMRKLALILTAAAVLAGCSWETYTTESGRTAVRQKYATGTPIVYQDGTYSKNMNYNQFRPERRAVQSNQAEHAERGQNWQNRNLPTNSQQPNNNIPKAV